MKGEVTMWPDQEMAAREEVPAQRMDQIRGMPKRVMPQAKESGQG